jgi:hypothetical protein
MIIKLTAAGEKLSHRLPDPLELRLVSNLSDLDTGHVKQVSAVVDELLSMVEVANAEKPSFDAFMDQVSNSKNPLKHLDK